MAKTEVRRPGRNERCRCGSGKKYKHCCLSKDETADRKAREKAAKAAKAAGVEEPVEGSARRRPPQPRADQPWKRGAQNTRGFQKFTGPRKVGNG